MGWFSDLCTHLYITYTLFVALVSANLLSGVASICPNSDVDIRAKAKVFLSLNRGVVFTATRLKLIVRL